MVRFWRSMRRTSCRVRTSIVEEIAEPLGRGHQQLLPVGDHAADVIRQAAVGERDVAAPLEDEDFGVFIHAAEPRGARGPAGHAADDQAHVCWT